MKAEFLQNFKVGDAHLPKEAFDRPYRIIRGVSRKALREDPPCYNGRDCRHAH